VTGHRQAQFLETHAPVAAGTQPPELRDLDTVHYWSLSPSELATSIIDVID
jgi:hypothetical protein